jgi:hypothetical protein
MARIHGSGLAKERREAIHVDDDVDAHEEPRPRNGKTRIPLALVALVVCCASFFVGVD